MALNEKLTQKYDLSIGKLLGLQPKEKAKDNSVINDLPSVEDITQQKKISPPTPKSTFGLLGFANDQNEDPLTAILLQHAPKEEDLRAMTENELFGTLQINTPTDGGVQTKTIEVSKEFLNTLDQEKIARMSAEQQTELMRIINKFGLKNTSQPVFQLTHDQVVDPQGKNDPKKTIAKGAGMRRFFDDINSTINGKLSGLKVLKDKASSQQANIESQANTNTEVAAPAIKVGSILPSGDKAPQPTEVDLDRPFAGLGQFA